MRAAQHHPDLERRGNQRMVIRHLYGDGHDVDGGIGDQLLRIVKRRRPQLPIRQRTDGGNVPPSPPTRLEVHAQHGRFLCRVEPEEAVVGTGDDGPGEAIADTGPHAIIDGAAPCLPC